MPGDLTPSELPCFHEIDRDENWKFLIGFISICGETRWSAKLKKNLYYLIEKHQITLPEVDVMFSVKIFPPPPY